MTFSKLVRLFQTVRHLTAEQWFFRFVCRGRRLTMRHAPALERRLIGRAADALPDPDLGAASLTAVSKHVLQLQTAVHGRNLEGIEQGRVTLLNRTIEFGSQSAISFRVDLSEGNNPLWRMNLAYMGYLVPLLATGRRAALDLTISLLDRLDREGDWSVPGVFRDVWNAYTVSHRLINLLSGLHLYLAAGGAMDASEKSALQRRTAFLAAFLRGNLERDLQYNHLLKNYVALSVFSACCADPPPSLGNLRKSVPASIDQQFLNDGTQAERCPMYQALSLLDLRILDACGLFRTSWEPMLATVIGRAERSLAVMTHPDGDIALFNDSWIGEAPASGALVPEMPMDGMHFLADAGYVRLSGASDTVLFDCGACGPDDNPAHAHADLLSTEMSVAGKRLIVDFGVPTYSAGAQRNASRSAAYHNGPAIDDAEPIDFWGSFRVGRRVAAQPITDTRLAGLAPLWCAGGHRGYAPQGVEVRRFVGLWPGEMAVVVDAWLGGGQEGPGSAFLVDGDWSVQQEGHLRYGDTVVAVTAILGRLEGPSDSVYWPQFGRSRPAHRLLLRPTTTGGANAAVVLFKWNDDATAPKIGEINRLVDVLCENRRD